MVLSANQIVRLDSEHAQSDCVGSSQRSRFLVLTKRSAVSGDENDSEVTSLLRKASGETNFKSKAKVSIKIE